MYQIMILTGSEKHGRNEVVDALELHANSVARASVGGTASVAVN
jgi:hypothetical protein